jgi:hypothetical protein
MGIRWGWALLMAGLAGCASLTPEQCYQADWYALGERDALGGFEPGSISRHVRACGKAGVVPDHGLWRAGYQDALPRFCAPDNGFRLGARDANYHGQCPQELDYGFLDGYRLGQDIYDLRRRITEVEGRISELRESMNDEHATDVSREADRHWLDHYKDERRRLQRQVWDLESRARERGYPATY